MASKLLNQVFPVGFFHRKKHLGKASPLAVAGRAMGAKMFTSKHLSKGPTRPNLKGHN